MRTLYKSSDRKDNCIYVGDPTIMEIPNSYTKVRAIYHVQRCPEEESDYHIVWAGEKSFFKFTSGAGKEAYESNRMITKTMSVDAITSPECLTALGKEELVVFFQTNETLEFPSPEKSTTTEQPES